MDTYNIPSVIKGLVPNIEKTKVLGRANTLKLRKLRDGEDYRGIYKGLDTYIGIVPGDIIMVENSEMGEYAYFGELNANLAIRSGAIATVVNGATRDANEVWTLDYPVFSKCYCCSDVKKRATVESFGQAITIQGIRICPGDLVFADINGIVVIQQHMETEVLSEAVRVVGTEKNILEKILVNMNAYDIYLQEGEF
jgi:regulator of RNase E activity RraA